jgi:hypothetical protein
LNRLPPLIAGHTFVRKKLPWLTAMNVRADSGNASARAWNIRNAAGQFGG